MLNQELIIIHSHYPLLTSQGNGLISVLWLSTFSFHSLHKETVSVIYLVIILQNLPRTPWFSEREIWDSWDFYYNFFYFLVSMIMIMINFVIENINIKIISGTLTLLLYVILENKEEMLKKIISNEKSILIVRWSDELLCKIPFSILFF